MYLKTYANERKEIMQTREITSEGLLQAAEDAIKRNETGIIIWSGPDKWRVLAGRLTATSAAHKKAMEYIRKGQGYWLYLGRDGSLETESDKAFAQILVLPAYRVESSYNYRRRNAASLKSQRMQGPITMMPSMHLSSADYNSKKG